MSIEDTACTFEFISSHHIFSLEKLFKDALCRIFVFFLYDLVSRELLPFHIINVHKCRVL